VKTLLQSCIGVGFILAQSELWKPYPMIAVPCGMIGGIILGIVALDAEEYRRRRR
jgi:hypothetical protein